jgi:hypothetical protein
MIKKTQLLLLITLTLLTSSCDFSEECHYKGDVQLFFDWKKLVDGDAVPQRMETFFYGEGTIPQSFILSKDTLLTGIAAGQQQVVTLNHPSQVTFTGTENFETLQLCLPTFMEKRSLHTTEAPMIYMDQQQIKVEPYDTVSCHLVPQPIIQQVNFEFEVIRDIAVAAPQKLDAELSGVSTAYLISRMEAVRSSAILGFSTQKESENEFKKSIRVLGLNPSVSGLEAIPKILSVSLTLEDGHLYSSEIDLTNKFENFQTGVLTCRIEIHITNQGMSMQIADWKTLDWGDIHIQ